MTKVTEPVAVELPTSALVRLDAVAKVEGGTRAEVASRLLVKALGDLDATDMLRQEAYSLLDLDEDLAGP